MEDGRGPGRMLRKAAELDTWGRGRSVGDHASAGLRLKSGGLDLAAPGPPQRVLRKVPKAL